MGVFTVGRQVALEIDMPAWWLANASVDMDFRRGLYYDSSTPSVQTAAALLSCTRASTGYAKNSSGTWISFAVNELRITDLGLLCEDARTNNLLNSTAPATQTTASLATGIYTLWVEGTGSALASAGSATITGAVSATENNPDTFTVTVAGTVTVTVSGSLTRFQLELGEFASSFILTTGATATRAADAVACTGSLATVFGTMPHSVCADIKVSIVSGTYSQIVANSSGSNISLLNVVAGGDSAIGMYNGASVLQGDFFASSFRLSTGMKVASAQATSQRSIVGGGGTVGTDTATTTALANPSLGSNVSAGEHFNGLYRRVTVWNSKLADATLQALTA